jgi:deoxyhypusine synthase
VKALLDKRARYESRASEIGEEALFADDEKARGYLRPREGYRLFANREELVRRLVNDVKKNERWLQETLDYPLAAIR